VVVNVKTGNRTQVDINPDVADSESVTGVCGPLALARAGQAQLTAAGAACIGVGLPLRTAEWLRARWRGDPEADE
jgi:hypothetical protein